LRGAGIFDRSANLGLGRQRHLGLDVTGHGFEDIGRAA
jgi:hypothetical protein